MRLCTCFITKCGLERPDPCRQSGAAEAAPAATEITPSASAAQDERAAEVTRLESKLAALRIRIENEEGDNDAEDGSDVDDEGMPLTITQAADATETRLQALRDSSVPCAASLCTISLFVVLQRFPADVVLYSGSLDGAMFAG